MGGYNYEYIVTSEGGAKNKVNNIKFVNESNNTNIFDLKDYSNLNHYYSNNNLSTFGNGYGLCDILGVNEIEQPNESTQMSMVNKCEVFDNEQDMRHNPNNIDMLAYESTDNMSVEKNYVQQSNIGHLQHVKSIEVDSRNINLIHELFFELGNCMQYFRDNSDKFSEFIDERRCFNCGKRSKKLRIFWDLPLSSCLGCYTRSKRTKLGCRKCGKIVYRSLKQIHCKNCMMKIRLV